MSKSLVIVESPAKARTITRFLGKGVTVKASMGHVRDLPKKTLGVDVEKDFEQDYEILPDKKKVIAELKKAVKGVDAVYLAPDPDREGEAICWHLAEALASTAKNKPVHRIMLHEITKRAVRQAMDRPGTINQDKVEAQQARRVLDRLVGYKISPLLWEKVRRGLSAGRVQSVALRIICDREREIKAFTAEEYWTIDALLAAGQPPQFQARLSKKDGKKAAIGNEDEAKQILKDVDGVPFVVQKVESKVRKKNPPPPFITSQLQQEMYRRFGYPVRKTMMLAQRLYEGKELGSEGSVGLITYMRTDSTRVSDQALAAVRDHIGAAFGDRYLPDKPRMYKSRKGAQDAHEAIRPTSLDRDPDSMRPHLSEEELKVYRVIWNRFVASQMVPAEYDTTSVEIGAGAYTFRASGRVLRFDGFLRVFGGTAPKGSMFADNGLNGGNGKGDGDGKETGAKGDTGGDGSAGTDEGQAAIQGDLPQLSEGEVLDLKELLPEQHFTKPPPRYTEATLVRELEENGIGRPSTYASIISVIQNREYVGKEKGKFIPTELGLLVSELLVESFVDLMDVKYTAKLEEQLDAIEAGRTNWVEALRQFHTEFVKTLEKAHAEMRNIKAEAEPTGEKCEKCGNELVIKWGRFGRFIACSNYPECRNTREIPGTVPGGNGNGAPGAEANGDAAGAEEEPEPCEKCGSAMVLKKGRFGPFLACSGYPECRNTRKITGPGGQGEQRKPDEPLDEECPSCGKTLVKKHGRFGEFIACSGYPECRYIKHEETGVNCPNDGCGGKIVVKKSKRGRTFYGCNKYPDCDVVMWKKPLAETCPSCNSPYLLETFKGRGKARHPVIVCPNEECEYAREEEAASSAS